MPRAKKFDAMQVAKQLAEEIRVLPDTDIARIPDMFAALPITPMQRYDVFQLLDEKPGYFRNMYEWHSKLRVVRNTPSMGKRLFATFS